MKSLAFKFAASTFVLGIATLGVQLDGSSWGLATAAATESRTEQQAMRFHRTAQQALAAGNLPDALAAIEQAVALAPRDAGYRTMLGDLYMKSGRFQSAEAAYRDVLAIDRGQTRVTMSLALMQVANGRQQAALATLDSIQGSASPADLGLAYALAGSPARGVEILEPAARTVGASARVRQNLALAYALGGDWQRARTIAAQDVSPAELTERMTQWAAMSRSTGHADQVASLLGVHPVQDAGLPVRLALQSTVPVAVAAAAADPAPAPVQIAAAMPLPAPAPVAIPVAVAEAEPAPLELVPMPQDAQVHAALEQPEWGIDDRGAVSLPAPAPEMRELPARVQYAAATEALVRPDPVLAGSAPRATPRAAARFNRAPAGHAEQPRRAGSGGYVVQIGAFSNAANAERAWQHAQRSFGLASEQPVTMTVDHNGRLLHRVAIAGFGSRGDAAALCAGIRGRGGECFVRNSAGDASVRWAARYARNRRA